MTGLGIFISFLAAANIIAFCVMGYDKYQAKNHLWRVSERTLMLLALIFGAVGEWIGMYVFRHKTKHIKFVVGVPACVLINAVLSYFIIKAL